MSAEKNVMLNVNENFVEVTEQELEEEEKDSEFLQEQKRRYDLQTVEMVLKGIWGTLV